MVIKIDHDFSHDWANYSAMPKLHENHCKLSHKQTNFRLQSSAVDLNKLFITVTSFHENVRHFLNKLNLISISGVTSPRQESLFSSGIFNVWMWKKSLCWICLDIILYFMIILCFFILYFVFSKSRDVIQSRFSLL